MSAAVDLASDIGVVPRAMLWLLHAPPTIATIAATMG